MVYDTYKCGVPVSHFDSRCTWRRRQSVHTSTVGAHVDSRCTRRQSVHTSTVGAHVDSRCTRRQSVHTSTVGAHVDSRCTRQQSMHHHYHLTILLISARANIAHVTLIPSPWICIPPLISNL